MFYERALTDNSSAQLGFFYTGFSVGDTEFRGFGITPEFRYYPMDLGAPRGFYLGPYLRYQNLTLTVDADPDFGTEEAKATLSTFGGGVVIGYQWLFGDKISFDIFGGPNFNSGTVKVKEGDGSTFETGSFEGFGARVGVTLGYAF